MQEFRELECKSPPDYVGGNKIPICRGHLAGETENRALDRTSAESRDCSRTWRRSRDAQTAAEARLLPRKRGKEEEADVEKKLRGGAGVGCFRSELISRVREETRGRGYL